MDDDPVPYFPLQLNLDSRSAAPPFDPFYQTIDETRNQGGVGGNQSHAYYASVGKPSPPHYDTVADQSHPHYATVGDRNPAHYSGDQNPTHYSGDQNPTHYTDDRNPAHYLDGRNPAQYSDDRNPAYYSDIKEHTPPPYASVMDQHHPHYAVVGNQNRSHSSLVGGRPNPPQRHDYSDTQFINNDIYASIEEANAEEGDLHSYDSEEGDIRSYGSHYEETQKPNVQRLSQEIMVQRLSFNDEDSTVMSLGNAVCSRCAQGFEPEEEMVNSEGEIWHTRCFVCAQCFQPFPSGIFYEYDGRKYCEHDFRVLFAPCCGKCGEFINGRVIKALNLNWHPNCFQCQICQEPLADSGFMKNAGRALCRDCNAKEKALGMGKYICHKCHQVIDEAHIKYKGEAYHPYHFNCHSCGTELTAAGREKGGELYCLRCHDKMGIPICGACRRPIEERVVHALGKTWHVEHFVCAKCEKPFLGHRHYEKKGLAYCETHYHQLFGNICFVCNSVIAGDVFSALNKAWCVNHFACSTCDRKMSQKSKFFEFDLKPVCKNCYERFPAELKKRQKKAYDSPKK